MNANVLMAFDRVELGRLFALPLQPLKTHLTLQDGKLRLNDLVARTAEGNVAGKFLLDGAAQVALWEADLRWSGVKPEDWLKQPRRNGGSPFVSGSLVGQASLKEQGRSTAQILGSLDGTVTTSLRHGRVSHLVIEAAGLDSVLRPRALVVDTGDSTVWADGGVSLKDELLDLRLVVTPKDFSPLAPRRPSI